MAIEYDLGIKTELTRETVGDLLLLNQCGLLKS